MTDSRPRIRLSPWLLPLLATVLIVAAGMRHCAPVRDPVSRALAGRTTISHQLAVERVQAVAKLVSSETTVRDVVIYENTRLGATKKSLVVVTGRILAGFDLERKETRVEIDSAARRITITLPPAEILGVEITDVRTYDERAGLLNPFRPADRDSIFRLAREQIARAATQSAALEHANRSARQLLETLFSAEGYTTVVRIGVGGVIRKEE
ncbi:MAG TPA: DUF4230 domain-containing protein [Gemmatimonadaceae bacterium]|nr:DUF4230 domain-containing protein [Gemmatimonadaceae bacterium]